jgi:hypothetical protein
VSDYSLDDQGLTSAEAKDFSSSLCVQTCSEAHVASYSMGTKGGPLPGEKHGWGMTLTISHLVLRSRMSWRYNSSPPWQLHGSSRTVLLLLIINSWFTQITGLMFHVATGNTVGLETGLLLPTVVTCRCLQSFCYLLFILHLLRLCS